jgi:hypothetical protein
MTFVTKQSNLIIYLCPVKFIRTIALLTATTVLLLHALIPHDHHTSKEISFLEKSQPSDLFEQIALGFHLSQTDGHLEDFSVENASIDVDQQQLLAVLSVTVFGIRAADLQPAQLISTEQNTSFKSLNVSGFSHRGPPII